MYSIPVRKIYRVPRKTLSRLQQTLYEHCMCKVAVSVKGFSHICFGYSYLIHRLGLSDCATDAYITKKGATETLIWQTECTIPTRRKLNYAGPQIYRAFIGGILSVLNFGSGQYLQRFFNLHLRSGHSECGSFGVLQRWVYRVDFKRRRS